MSGLEPGGLLLALLWGTLAGVDQASWPQGLLSRPLVAGGVAGLLLGDPVAGVVVGAVLELFALDVLPIGATRYPDFGPATVGGVVVAAGGPPGSWLGLAVGLGLVMALASRPLMEWQRRANAGAARAAAARLAEGDPALVGRLQASGLARDAARSLALAAAGLGLALVIRSRGAPPDSLAQPLALVAVAGGLAAAVRGAVRAGGQGGRLAWVAAGVAGGLALAAWT